MSISITINDTHRAIETLKSSGASKELAESIVSTVKSAELSSSPATQADLTRAVSDLETRFYKAFLTFALSIIGATVGGVAIVLQIFFAGGV